MANVRRRARPIHSRRQWQDVLRCPSAERPSPRQQAARPDRRRGPGAAVGDGRRLRCAAPRPDVDALVAATRPRPRGQQLAAAAAAAAPPTVAAALTTVAAERAAHAQALSDEITRMSGETPQHVDVTSSTSARPPRRPAPSANHSPPPRPRRRHRRPQAVRRQRRAAGRASRSGYRAGLLGSIAAACTAASTVAPRLRGRRRDVTRAAEPRRGRRTVPTPRCSTRSPTSTA